MKVAFLGLGAIGAPMARHLTGDPFELAVWNRTSEKAHHFAENTPCRVVATPSDAARGADVVVTCLPSSLEVAALLDGTEGLLAGLDTGSLFVDCTSGDPGTSRAIASRLAEKGVDFVDAPVSGGVKGAVAGTLTVMCGGSEHAIDRARPVLSAFGKKIVVCGPVGAGHAVKAMNQALLAIHIWSAGEALATLAKLGVDATVALEVIKVRRARTLPRICSRACNRTRLPEDIQARAPGQGRRDCCGDCPRRRHPVTVCRPCRATFHEAHAELGEEADHVEAVKVIEERSGVRIA